MIGFYLQHVHGYDLLKMKVDFNQDEFGEIWLMHVEKLFVRKPRKVPTDDGNKIADFVLQHMDELNKVEEARKKLEAKKAAEFNALLSQAGTVTNAVLKKTMLQESQRS